MKRAIILALALFLACSPPHIDRARWQSMNAADKTLYVRQLLGGEHAKAAKGGSQPTHSLPAEEYVRLIDAAYAGGETRDVDAVFTTLSAGGAGASAANAPAR
ncbi:MAG: hypothetical protein JOZ54_13910 [Acidobacteria bacterium]|nr:hypothetical protein [Acidobacteriota bacterium]